jgi:hypothetical protein
MNGDTRTVLLILQYMHRNKKIENHIEAMNKIRPDDNFMVVIY